MNVAIVGAGVIAARYAECIAEEPLLTLAGAMDAVTARAERLVDAQGGADYG